MRSEPNIRVEQYRVQHGQFRSPAGVNWGLFYVKGLRIISSGGTDNNPESAGWEHVSVSREDRIPSWDDMCLVKELFWEDEETVLQFHPAKSKYVNVHPFVLHLWRKAGTEVELPPKQLIA